MNTQNQPHLSAQTLVLLLGAILAGAAAVVLPAALLIVPALFAYVMCRTRPAFLALFGGAYAAVAFLLMEPLTAASLGVLCIGVAFALYWMQTQKRGNTETALVISGISLLGLYAVVCLPGILSGEGAFAPIQNAVNEMIRATKAVAASVSGLPTAINDGLQSYLALMDQFGQLVPTILVPALCVMAFSIGLANLLFFRLFARKRVSGLTPLRPFRLWAIPQHAAYGMLFLVVVSLLLLWFEWSYAEAFSATINVLVGLPFMLQGLCTADFLIVRSGKNIAAKRAGVYLAAAVLFLYTQSILMMLGCFDQVFHFRQRASMPPPPMPRDGF